MPLLHAISAAEEDPATEPQHPHPEDLVRAVRLGLRTTRRTLQDMWSAGLITGVEVEDPDGGFYALAIRLTPEGRRAVGQWPPSFEVGAIMAALTAMADDEPDEEERRRLRRAVDAFSALGRDFAVNVAATVATKVTGLG